ncbi:MAG TPA: xylulokinase [Candidatus Binataceae bacterium]|nr:xylulokinase [Candidatus Binataceae bacterium]
MPLVMGVDSSTQSTKVEIRDAHTGRLVASGSAAHPATSPPRSEQSPAAWWVALQKAIRIAGRRARLTEVVAVSVAAQQHGMVVLDDKGRVIRSAKLWNDTESAPDASALVEKLGAGKWAAACGSVPTASFTITKLAWLKRAEPESFARVARVMLPHDWLTMRLCGEFVTDRGDASGTGYWSPKEGRYREDLLAPIDSSRDWNAMFPLVRASTEAAGIIQSKAARDLGLHSDVIVGPGTGDNMAGALGIALDDDSVAVSIGTSGTVYAVSPHAVADATGAVAGFADASGAFLPLVCTLNAARVTDTVAHLINVDQKTLNRIALKVPYGAGGVVMVPYFDGERTPNLPDATGILSGLRTSTTSGQIARAAFEGVACSMLDCLDLLGRNGIAMEGWRIVLLGGGGRSPAYQRIIADLSGRTVVIPKGEEHVAAGACVQAAAVLSNRPPREIARSWKLGSGKTIEPDAAVDRASIRAAYSAAVRRAI